MREPDPAERWTDANLRVQGYRLAPELPPNPTPRRHAFKLAALWLLAVGVLYAVGEPAVALGLGIALVAVCGLVTTTNFCIPSTLLGLWWSRRDSRPTAARV